jgi:hypothetical protein
MRCCLLSSAAVCLLALSALHAAEQHKIPVKRDTWISAANREESDTNGGKAPRIKLKVWQEFGLLDFDVSELKGKKIESAKLYVAPDGGVQFGGDRNTDLRWFTLSTISSDWVEGQGAQYSKDDAGKGATHNEASYKTRPWTIPGSKSWDVILGNGKTLRCDVDGKDPSKGWFELPLDKQLVEALVANASYGMLIMDGSTGTDRNSYIAAMGSTKAPYLLVTISGEDKDAPAAPAELNIKPSIVDAGSNFGSVLLSSTVPADAFAYDIKINGTPVPRWQIPFAAKAGTTQTILLEHQTPDTDLQIELCAIDAAGNISAPAVAKGKSGPKAVTPRLPASDFTPRGGQPPVTDGKLSAWAFPEICKLDPLSGRIILEDSMDDGASKNSIWDASNATVQLAAARGDIAGFQLALHAINGPLKDVKITLAGLDDIAARQWRTWFVKVGNQWQAEYALPIKSGTGVSIPADDNKITDQKATAVAIDLIIPENAKAGDQSGTITIAAEGITPLTLTLKLKIYDIVIPKEINFNPEMNAYSGPGIAGSDFFFDAFRLAHYHRSTINRVPYSQSGRSHEDWTPATSTDGRVTDWSRFDKNIGPLLDGSAFKDNPRAGVPVPCLYLPHFENWPMSLTEHFKPGVPTSGENWKGILDIKGKTPEESFSTAYKNGFINNVRDFVTHCEEKGYTRTLLQAYNNNKVYQDSNKSGMKGTAWVMDEPFEYLDWQALQFFSRLFHEGAKGATKAKFQYRGDISRPMWQGNCMDGLMEVMYVGGGGFEMLPLIRDTRRRTGMRVVAYGAANDQKSANHGTTAWCLKAYVHDCDGVLPWQSLGDAKSFDHPEDPANGNALIVDGQRFGVNAVASYRVHAFRVGAQLVELLRLLEKKNGWGRAHIGALVSQVIPMSTEFKQSFQDDAAAVKFKGLNGNQFTQLKEGVLKLLAK